MRELGRAASLALLMVPLLALGTGCPPEVPASEGPPLTVRVRGFDYHWSTRYPGQDGVLDTADDRLAPGPPTVPELTRVTVELASGDKIYSWEEAERDIRENAIPGLARTAVFETGGVGRIRLRGDQMCGYSHPLLSGWISVLERAEFERWLHALPEAPPGS